VTIRRCPAARLGVRIHIFVAEKGDYDDITDDLPQNQR